MRKHAIHFEGHGLTKQSFKNECDINKIMEKFQKSGAISHYASHAPDYGECTQANLQDALNIVADANTMFEELPSSIRAKFHNDAGQFLDFVQDKKNLEEMRELGLANKAAPKPAPVSKKPSADDEQKEPKPAAKKESED